MAEAREHTTSTEDASEEYKPIIEQLDPAQANTHAGRDVLWATNAVLKYLNDFTENHINIVRAGTRNPHPGNKTPDDIRDMTRLALRSLKMGVATAERVVVTNLVQHGDLPRHQGHRQAEQTEPQSTSEGFDDIWDFDQPLTLDEQL